MVICGRLERSWLSVYVLRRQIIPCNCSLVFFLELTLVQTKKFSRKRRLLFSFLIQTSFTLQNHMDFLLLAHQILLRYQFVSLNFFLLTQAMNYFDFHLLVSHRPKYALYRKLDSLLLLHIDHLLSFRNRIFVLSSNEQLTLRVPVDSFFVHPTDLFDSLCLFPSY